MWGGLLLEYHTIVLYSTTRVGKIASQSTSPESFIFESVVRGHHIYKRVWTPVLGEKLGIVIEEDNNHDARVVAVQRRHCGRPPTSRSNLFLK